MIAALILAAGQSVRFGNPEQPKQFTEIAGRPLYRYAVDLYAALPAVTRIVVVAGSARLAQVRTALDGDPRITVAAGGATRQQSVENGLSCLESAGLADEDIVVLHNGASPNTPRDLVERCLHVALDQPVVQAWVPALFTTFSIEGDTLGGVLPRDRIGWTCDPTVYRADALRRAMTLQRSQGLAGDSTIDAARALGIPVGLVRSTHANIKVTTPWDLVAVQRAMGL